MHQVQCCRKSFNAFDPTNLTHLLSPDTLFTFKTELDVIYNNQYFSPNDVYGFQAFFFAFNNATNNTLSLSIAIESNGAGDFSTVLDVEHAHMNTTDIYPIGGGPPTEQIKYYTLNGNIVHSLRARAITYSMFSINWILTLCSMIVTSVTFSPQRRVKEVVAILPVTVILTIPVIRNLYSGSPPYGILLGKHRKLVVLPCKN